MYIIVPEVTRSSLLAVYSKHAKNEML